jgi:putative membrane protein
MVMNLTDIEKQQISKEIENLEEKSSAELIAVITNKSSSYKYETIIISSIICAFVSLLLIISSEITGIKLFQWQTITFFLSYFIFFQFDSLILKVLPKSYKYEKASTYANKQFSNLGLQTTKTKQAIMFFVSSEEKFVEIITDSKIKEKIKDNYWQDIINEFIKDVKNKQISNGYLKAIKSCNNILIKEFPIQDDDINELTNDVIELNK